MKYYTDTPYKIMQENEKKKEEEDKDKEINLTPRNFLEMQTPGNEGEEAKLFGEIGAELQIGNGLIEDSATL